MRYLSWLVPVSSLRIRLHWGSCRLLGTKPVSERMMEYCQLGLTNKRRWNFNRHFNIFTQENVSEKAVCLMADILPRSQCVNVKGSHSQYHIYCLAMLTDCSHLFKVKGYVIPVHSLRIERMSSMEPWSLSIKTATTCRQRNLYYKPKTVW